MTLKIDSKSVAANFNAISPTDSWDNRILVSHSDTDTHYVVTDSSVDLNRIEYVFRNADKTFKLQQVDPSPEFNEALAFYATRAGTHSDVEWEISCDERYKQKCPLNWFQLEETDNPEVRNCGLCSKPVHLVKDFDEAKLIAKNGLCTAYASVDNFDEAEIGDIDTDIIEEELDEWEDWMDEDNQA